MKTTYFALLAISILFPVSSFAFDFLGFAKNEALVCYHPTAKPEKAEVKYETEPKTNGDITTAVVKVYYKGWIKDHSMEVKITALEASGKTLIQTKMLVDTNTKPGTCNYGEGYMWYEPAAKK